MKAAIPARPSLFAVLCNFASICLTLEISRLLNVNYQNGNFGPPVKVSRANAFGIIAELSRATQAESWAREMNVFLNGDQGVHPDVVEFHTMGDMPEDLANNNFMKSLSTEEELELQESSYFAVYEEMSVKSLKPLHNATFGHAEATHPLSHRTELNNMEDMSAWSNEITVNWSWGIKFLFQAVVLEKSSGENVEGDEWRLWPFAQPDMNNRLIDVDRFLWNHENPSKHQIIPKIFGNRGLNFHNQNVCSVPCIVKPMEEDDAGLPLISMVESGDKDMTFRGTAAHKCNLTETEKCHFALTVRLLSALCCCFSDS